MTGTALVLLCIMSLSGCRALVARFWDKAGVHAHMNACPDALLAVGDSLQFHATVMISNAPGGMQGPYDNVTLYTSEERPKSFQWRLSYPPPSVPGGLQYYPIGSAELTRTGVLIAKDTGVVYVHVSTAGKQASRIEMRIIPKVERFTLLPHDTSVRVGDTISLRADAEFSAPSKRRAFAWSLGIDTFETRRVERVERDPDIKGGERDPRLFPLVAIRPGVSKVAACFAGARRDTTTIHITGEPRVVNRDVPPRVRFSPRDTSVWLGDDFSARMRILNENLGNGMYRWVTSTGDGTRYADSANSKGVVSAFGSERMAFVEHRYFAPGKYPMTFTVTDSSGRSTTFRATYTAAVREFSTMVLLPEGRQRVRLRVDEEPDVAIALIANKAKSLWPAHIAGALVLTRMNGVPPLTFGKTVFDPELDGRRRVTKDINGDGEPDDVFYLDKAMLIRNGDLHVGRNRLVVNGVIARRVDRPGLAEPFWPPIRAIVEFDAIP